MVQKEQRILDERVLYAFTHLRSGKLHSLTQPSSPPSIQYPVRHMRGSNSARTTCCNEIAVASRTVDAPDWPLMRVDHRHHFGALSQIYDLELAVVESTDDAVAIGSKSETAHGSETCNRWLYRHRF